MTSPARLDRCPDCGTPLTNESWAQGVCLSCMARLAIEQPTLHEELQADQRHGRGNASTLDSASAEISPGKILGGRYQIRARLGGGGMGEVWQAFDLKLRVDVALKALHPQLLASERALETLRQEVRTAREVVSPNVCRVYQLEEIEGRELVSMEYVDGHTLAEVLRERSPLPMDEAREIAAQFLAGLEAIHAAELVHRDIKPENVMLTRAGRVVVMDFGVAKILAADETKTVAGTPAYMSPEQALGEALDARADVFSSAILLAEMIAPKGVRAREDRHALWESCRQTPPDLADTPWAPALRSALSPRRDDRPGSAAELSRALEELTVRAAEEGVTPYPGLASFTSENAKFFFGRELEVEEMWKKLRQPHLLALIGPSGAGKSSFVRAGLLAAMPDDWRAVVAQPGNRPFMALGESLVEELAGDTESMRELLRFEEPDVAVSLVSRWRERHGHALIVLDQFEELFTQNPEEVQERFADLLGRLALEADVHVLVSMRDDFFMHCNRHESLRPVFSEVTGLETLSGSGLRRALVQPALRCGYRFEDDALIDGMVSAVEGERGALPLIAFAAAQMWERRDRERGLLTRAAYERVGGVEGALGRHAESTLEKIGEENLPVVRGLFRRLVTAQRTRATWDREELLSAFEDREAANRVLTELIDARLLTSYDLDGDGEKPRQRVEIIHESLLRSWPRLVRWQAQDEDGAQLLDQLRQSALIWEERGRPDDLLWTGSAFKEYELWRERYPGGMSSLEEDFAGAMVGHAHRQRRRRRVAAVSAFAVLLMGLLVVGAFWRRSVAETKRAEASELVALGRSELAEDPTASSPTGALAHAIASLQVHDSPAVRELVLEALWSAPVVSHIGAGAGHSSSFSADGSLIPGPESEEEGVRARTFYRRGGTVARVVFPPDLVAALEGESLRGPSGVPGRDAMIEFAAGQVLVVYSTQTEDPSLWWRPMRGSEIRLPDSEHVLTFEHLQEEAVVRAWSLSERTVVEVGRLDSSVFPVSVDRVRAGGPFLAVANRGEVCVYRWRQLSERPLVCHEHARRVVRVELSPGGELIATADDQGRVRVRRTEDLSGALLWERRLDRPITSLAFSPSGERLAAYNRAGQRWAEVWDLLQPPETEPLVFLRDQVGGNPRALNLDPTGQWLAIWDRSLGLGLWPTGRRHPFIIEGPNAGWGVAFSPDGSRIASVELEGTLRLWSRSAAGSGTFGSFESELFRRPQGLYSVAWHPDGRRVLVGEGNANVWLVDIESGAAQRLPESDEAFFSRVEWGHSLVPVAISPDGRFAVGAGYPELLVWDLHNEDEVRLLLPGSPDKPPPAGQDPAFLRVGFTPDSRSVFVSGWSGTRLWSLEDGSERWLGEGQAGAVTRDNRFLYATMGVYPTYLQQRVEAGVKVYDLETGEERLVAGHPLALSAALDPDERVLVTGGADGEIRVGPIDGGEPHRLLGHEGAVNSVDVSPDGRWIASMGTDGAVRLWPMPDVTKPPIHTLPRAELLALLRRLTNFRAVEDPESDTGYSIDYAPFPGWADYPDWLPLADDAGSAMAGTSGGS